MVRSRAQQLLQDRMVITQHPELVEALREKGLFNMSSQVIDHVDDPNEVFGKHVIGMVSAEMKILAESVTSLSYNPETKEYGEPRTFTVEELARIPVNDEKHLPIRFNNRQ